MADLHEPRAADARPSLVVPVPGYEKEPCGTLIPRRIAFLEQ